MHVGGREHPVGAGEVHVRPAVVDHVDLFRQLEEGGSVQAQQRLGEVASKGDHPFEVEREAIADGLPVEAFQAGLRALPSHQADDPGQARVEQSPEQMAAHEAGGAGEEGA